MIRPSPNQQAGKKRPASIAAFTIAMAALLLAACGGGGSEGSTASSGGGTAGSGTVTPAKVTLPQVLQDPAYTPVVDTTYLSVASSAAQASKAAAAASPAPTITPTELLNWAEAMFPQRFPAGPQNQTHGALTFRYYLGSDSYVGIANNVIYAFGADTANRLVNAGNLSDFNCTVKPGSCMIPTPVQAFTCDTGAITCVEVISTGAQDQTSVPLTFGQPFKSGDWKHKTTGLIARDNFRQPIAIQTDEISSHRDGSARFAVVSAQVPNLKAGERRIISFFTGSNNSIAQTLPSDPAWNLELTANLFAKQITKIKFGNRNGHTAGTPFGIGDSIEVKIVGKSTEQFKLVIDSSTAGGDYTKLTKIAEAFMAQINQQSQLYTAYKLGEGGGYENLWITTKAGDGGSFVVQFQYAGPAALTQQNLTTYESPRTLSANGQIELKSKISQGTSKRLNGAVVQEFTVVTPFRDNVTGATHPQLTARMHTRLYEAGKRIRTDVAFENNWAYNPNPGNITYELTVKQGGRTVHHQPAFTHYHHTRWKKTIWSGAGEPMATVRHHMGYFMDSGITWNYDRSIQVSEATLSALATRLSQSNTEPMGNAFITHYFPTTGGREEIGPVPRWTALFLVTQDDRARAAMLANADAAAGIPVHYRDAATDQVIDLDRHPGVALRHGNSTTADALPTMSDSATPWTVDSAHQGSFVFIPYVVTGDAFYLDEIMFWAAMNMGSVNPGYRNYGSGLLYSDQVRGQAWSLRSLVESARVVPDTHVMKTYFQSRLDTNLNWYVNNYPQNPTQSKIPGIGAIEKLDDPGKTAPWQNDFFNIVLALMAEEGHPAAQTYNNWLTRFTVGRFLNSENGYCVAKAPAPYVQLVDANGAYTDSWATIFKQTWPTLQCTSSTPIDPGSYPDSAYGYAANARTMLAATANANTPNARQAYFAWRIMTPNIDKAQTADPTWAIVPR